MTEQRWTESYGKPKKHPWRDLAVGQSFVADVDSSRMRGMAYDASKRLSPKRFEAKVENDKVMVRRVK